MQNNAPIGIFDSGIGGTSIWKEIHQLLPNESTIYLSDSKNAPYGHRSKDEIIQLSIKNTEFLIEHGCKLVVVACNTATTNAIHYLRSHFPVSFVGIEPAIKPAALHTKTGSVGILATKGTLSSELFYKTSQSFTQDIDVTEVIGEGIVQLMENGKMHSKEMHELLKNYLAPMLANNIDVLVLGCTHYPYLIPQIKELLPKAVRIIDSGEAVARQTQRLLEQQNLVNTSDENRSWTFYSNGNISTLKNFLGSVSEKITIEYLEF